MNVMYYNRWLWILINGQIGVQEQLLCNWFYPKNQIIRKNTLGILYPRNEILICDVKVVQNIRNSKCKAALKLYRDVIETLLTW